MSIERVGALVRITATTGRGVWFDAGDAFLALETGASPNKGTIRLAKNGANFAVPFDGIAVADVIKAVDGAQVYAAAAKQVAREPAHTLETFRHALEEGVQRRIEEIFAEKTEAEVGKIIRDMAGGKMPGTKEPAKPAEKPAEKGAKKKGKK